MDPLFECEGEMAARMASHDWSSSGLGDPTTWSQSLRTAVGIVLRTRYPMILTWGPAFVMLYNDAYIPTLGAKHPAALGGFLPEEFAEIWDAIGPMQRSVLAGGRATWDEDLPLVIERGSGPEETYFTFSYSHVPDDGDGPGGVLAVLSITTAEVVGAARLGLLDALSVLATTASTPEQAVREAVEVLGGARTELDGAAGYLRDGDDLRLVASTVDGLPTLVEAAAPGAGTWAAALARAVAGEEVVLTRDPVPPTSVRIAVALPLPGGGPAGVLVLDPRALRAWDDGHRRFVQLVADRVGQTLAAATERAREQERLRALAAIDAAKTAFLSNVSHEFRTPLTLLLGPLEDVLTGRRDRLGDDDVATMHDSAHRLLRLVNGLLDVASMEADGLHATPEPTELAPLTHDLLAPFGEAAQRIGLELVAALDDVGTVAVDPLLWEKVVLNLVSNAVKYTPEGRVEVALRRDGDDVVLTVADTGIGIPADHLDRVFERFHRVGDVGARSIEGTGIGLSQVQEAARAHGGRAEVTSESGRGTTFTVTIPAETSTGADDRAPDRGLRARGAADALAREVARSRGAEDDGTGPRPASGGGPRILVVDDNAAMRRRVADILAPLGEVRLAVDGRDALAVLDEQPADLVVTDVMMPGLDGVGLLEAIRAHDGLRGTPVVVLSARAGAEAATGALAAGADDYVVKPFTPDELVARCRTTLELSRLRSASAAQAARDTMLAGVSHDMQTPIVVITSGIEMLRSPALDDATRDLVAHRVRSRAKQLRRLVQQFLDWSRLAAGQELPVRLQPADLAEVASAVADDHDRVTVTILADRTDALVDVDRTSQVLHNLVDNALVASEGTVRIVIDEVGEGLVLRVEDDGPGVPEEIVARLFEAFGPSGSAGNGLGLHVARASARAQGGDLVLERTGPDGATFCMHVADRA